MQFNRITEKKFNAIRNRETITWISNKPCDRVLTVKPKGKARWANKASITMYMVTTLVTTNALEMNSAVVRHPTFLRRHSEVT